MADAQSRSTTSGYHVRPYRSADRDRFLALYETVWDCAKGREWFEWRFERNPYRPEVRMAVAESGTELVGAEPLLPFRLRVGDRVVEAYQPVDWIVHPDHRREGLFTRMTESVVEELAADASLLYNFPNDQLLPGLEKFDWGVVGPVTSSYRVQDAAGLGGDRHTTVGGRAAATVAKLGCPLVRRGLGVLDRFRAPPEDVVVERVDGVAVETVAALYDAARPNRAHVPRDRPFLEWRFANPRWETTTYVARRGGEPVASAIVATERVDGTQLSQLLDAQPMTGPAARPEAFEAILDAVVTDTGAADLLKAPASCYPEVLRQYGFWREDLFPLSAFATPTTHVVRPLPLEESGWTVDGYDLREPDSWRLAFADVDVG